MSKSSINLWKLRPGKLITILWGSNGAMVNIFCCLEPLATNWDFWFSFQVFSRRHFCTRKTLSTLDRVNYLHFRAFFCVIFSPNQPFLFCGRNIVYCVKKNLKKSFSENALCCFCPWNSILSPIDWMIFLWSTAVFLEECHQIQMMWLHSFNISPSNIIDNAACNLHHVKNAKIFALFFTWMFNPKSADQFFISLNLFNQYQWCDVMLINFSVPWIPKHLLTSSKFLPLSCQMNIDN